MKDKSLKTILSSIIGIVLVIIISLFGGDNILKNFTAESREIVSVNGLENISVQTGDSCISKIDINDNKLRVYYFDVGQADSILVVNKGKTMLIDAGNNSDGKLVVNNLNKIGISKLDYVIGTHPHEDHIGGLDDVIDNFDIGTVYMPKTKTTTKTYESVIDSIIKKKKKITVPKVGDIFNIGDAICEVMSIEDNSSNLNACSIVIRLEYDGISYLFTGDAEKENEANRSWPQTNVLKVGHHGSSTSSSQDFLNQIQPQLVIISVGKGNDYGHPHKETIKRFNNLNTQIFRTDENGNILLIQSK